MGQQGAWMTRMFPVTAGLHSPGHECRKVYPAGHPCLWNTPVASGAAPNVLPGARGDGKSARWRPSHGSVGDVLHLVRAPTALSTPLNLGKGGVLQCRSMENDDRHPVQGRRWPAHGVAIHEEHALIRRRGASCNQPSRGGYGGRTLCTGGYASVPLIHAGAGTATDCWEENEPRPLLATEPPQPMMVQHVDCLNDPHFP